MFTLFLAATRTDKGLIEKAALDEGEYETGVSVTDEQMAKLTLKPAQFHGEWNYYDYAAPQRKKAERTSPHPGASRKPPSSLLTCASVPWDDSWSPPLTHAWYGRPSSWQSETSCSLVLTTIAGLCFGVREHGWRVASVGRACRGRKDRVAAHGNARYMLSAMNARNRQTADAGIARTGRTIAIVCRVAKNLVVVRVQLGHEIAAVAAVARGERPVEDPVEMVLGEVLHRRIAVARVADGEEVETAADRFSRR